VQADDLASILAPPRDTGPGVGFRQGLVQAWDPATGSNQILVAGGTLTDVPILNTGEAVALKVGHVVGLLTAGGSWFILGRITTPGDPNFASASLAFGSAGASLLNFATNTTMTEKLRSNSLVVPTWADEAIVFVGGMVGVRNSTAITDSLGFKVGCFGGDGGAVAQDVPAGTWGSNQAVSRNQITGLSGGEVLFITGQLVTTNGVWAANASNAMFLHAIAIYKSNV
jgi:hypothetical protein